MYDGSKLATVGWTSSGQATRTSPAPDLRAAAPTRAAAPAVPRPPASASTLPNSPLCPSFGRSFSRGSFSIRSIAMFELPFRGGGIRPGGRRRHPGLAGPARDQAGDVPPIESRVDVDHHHVGGATV